MLDQQLISRLFTRPYNPVRSNIDIVIDYIRELIENEMSLNGIHDTIMMFNEEITEDRFYLCYQAAVMSI